jgi:hypothetical protein
MQFLRKPPDEAESIQDHPIHSPLDSQNSQIRLLVLHPGEFEDPVFCQLNIYSLEEQPVYEALSYVWGDAATTLPIYVGSQRKRVETTINLECALRHLRYQDRDRILWVDAICINQSDDSEKTHQVRMMRKIFAGAKRVLAWLGPETVDGQVAVQTLRRVAEDPNLHLKIDDPRDLSRPSINENDGIKLYTWFHECHWWNRIWTVQEFVAAKELIFICGGISIMSTSVCEFALNFLQHRNSCCPNLDHVNSILPKITAISYEIELIEFIRSEEFKLSFAQLLAQFRGRQATKPEDKVFGLFGLAEESDDFHETIVAYGLSAAEAYERCTTTILATSHSLDILSQSVLPCEASLEPSANHQLPLPSWVPNWAALIHTYTLRYHLNRSLGLYLYSASGQKTCDYLGGHDGLLQIKGITWDSISLVGEALLGTVIYRANAAIFRSWHSLAETTLPLQNYITSGTLENAFSRTLCIDYSVMPDRSLGRSNECHRPTFNLWWQQQQQQQPMIVLNDSEDGKTAKVGTHSLNLSKEVLGFDTSVLTGTYNRRFFISEKGYIGLAPSNAAPGDKIAVLFGGKVPYILRRNEPASTGTSGTTWTFLGDSYVHGIMDGEVIESLERGEVMEELITLK